MDFDDRGQTPLQVRSKSPAPVLPQVGNRRPLTPRHLIASIPPDVTSKSPAPVLPSNVQLPVQGTVRAGSSWIEPQFHWSGSPQQPVYLPIGPRAQSFAQSGVIIGGSAPSRKVHVRGFPTSFGWNPLVIGRFFEVGGMLPINYFLIENPTADGYSVNNTVSVVYFSEKDAEMAVYHLNGSSWHGYLLECTHTVPNHPLPPPKTMERQVMVLSRNVKVKHLPADSNGPELASWFECAGEVLTAVFTTYDDHDIRRSFGLGFVCFAAVDEAQRAIELCDGMWVSQYWRLEVNFAPAEVCRELDNFNFLNFGEDWR